MNALCRIALHGYARVGKDEVGKRLVEYLGLKRVALGDVIKKELDPLCRQYLGFSAFTEIDREKNRIRDLLISWTNANFDRLIKEFTENLPIRCVNTRIFRLEEALEWHRCGGIIIHVDRPGYGPVEPREFEELKRCYGAGLISYHINNKGDLTDLDSRVKKAIIDLNLRRDHGAQSKQRRSRRAGVGSLPLGTRI